MSPLLECCRTATWQFGSSGKRCRASHEVIRNWEHLPEFSSHLIMLISYPRAVRNCRKMAVPDIKTLNELKHSSYLLWKPRFRNQFASPVWSLDQQYEILSPLHTQWIGNSRSGPEISTFNKPPGGCGYAGVWRPRHYLCVFGSHHGIPLLCLLND